MYRHPEYYRHENNREEICVIQSCIMNTNHSKIVEDHERNLSYSHKSILFLGFLFLDTDLFLEVMNSGWYCSEQKQSSRPTSQNLENSFQKRIAKTSIPPMNQPSPLLWSKTLLPTENQNKESLDFWILFVKRKIMRIKNLSNCNCDICCLCCPTIEFWRNPPI